MTILTADDAKIIRRLNRDPLFKKIVEKLTTNADLDYEEIVHILTCAILFIRYYQNNNKYQNFIDLSYYIILKYSLKFNDYNPLYDFSVNFGFYPIAKSILNKNLLKNKTIDNFFIDIKLDGFKNESNNIQTIEQHAKSKSFLNDSSDEKSYLAPTSFGKSSLIIDYIRSLEKKLKIVIVVPTKSLLIQTQIMVREANLERKIITHDEMYNNETALIAIFTQERALRLLDRKNIYFDVLIIDEAHNILSNSSRSILLSRLISKNRIRNSKQKVIYLSPLIKDSDNLKLDEDQKISPHIINFNVKEPEIFEYKLNTEVYSYNRFVNSFYQINTGIEKFEYLKNNFSKKNFIYNRRPVNIERLAKELCMNLPEIKMTGSLIEIEKILKREVHEDFYGIKYLKFGLIYLHGKLPDLIKEYLEYKYKILPEIKYVIANTVILEGINLPIETLFIFNTRSLQGKELMNLIGRVNRLNDIFNQENTDFNKLLPKIHFINDKIHNGEKSNMSKKIMLLKSRIFEDKVENPILNSFNIEKIITKKEDKSKYRNEVELIQKNEKILKTNPNTEIEQIEKYLIETGINSYYSDLKKIAAEFIARLNKIRNKQLSSWDILSVMEKIEYLFINDVNNISDFTIKRLSKEKARNYYENYILVGRKNPINMNVKSQFEFLKKKARGIDPKLYIGATYGDDSYESTDYPNPQNKVYVNLATKTEEELINLAIVKLKIEDDFISFEINKFIVMMFDYKLITNDEYNEYIYGTTDQQKIDLTKYGLNLSLISKLEKDNQLKNISFDEFNNLIGNREFGEFVKLIDDFYKFEISRYLKI